jgi:hypothetical protein
MTIPPYDLQADDFRSYQLPDSMDATITATAQPGEPAVHWLARGLMAETCQRLLARPVTLQVIEHEHTVFISAVVSLASTVLSSDPLGDLTSVDLILIKHTARWALMLGDRMIATGQNVPAPRYLAEIAQIVQVSRRSAQPDTCRGPVNPPTHLW